jgi:D-beta-D-heptose 7-phosphate kinase/D-beta-D-heptose 1-phosphate adenosyltransferase
LSDYAKGSLANINEYIQIANQAGKKVLVDPKGNDFRRYCDATVLTPNLKEFEAVVGACASLDELVDKSEKLCESLSLDTLLVTRGEQGMSLISREFNPVHLSAEAHEVFDVTGAGDTVIATLAAALASGHELVHATALANRAAGLAVAKLGAVAISTRELNYAVINANRVDSGVVDESHLKSVLEDLRAENKKIIMTNGCFDILHAGHVSYLEQAKKLGDCLIVAVNDDDSVKRLKGEDRPVNPLADRLAVLAAMKAVDWVVSFTEDTPERIISEILPDVLVKGGDYMSDEIAGAESVKKNGGEVHIIPLYEGCSTSGIIKNLRSKDLQE